MTEQERIRLSKETLDTLITLHVDRYMKRLESGSPNVRVDETTALLGLWAGMRNKGINQLTDEEYEEVLESVLSGDYDGLPGVEEISRNFQEKSHADHR